MAQVVRLAQSKGVKIVLQEPYYSTKAARFVAGRIGAKAIVLPNNVGQDAKAKDYFSLFDTIIAGWKAAAR
jgi:ABC-type Zn uptake system ZnuABC Zn-binding protein ZnuA